jgi:hypothetical protein
MADSSDTVAVRLIAAATRDGAVVARRVVAGDVWGSCHLISHWLPTISSGKEQSACEGAGIGWLTVASGVVGLHASLRRFLPSGGFGSGHRKGVVGEVSDELQVPAKCLDVAGDGLDG